MTIITDILKSIADVIVSLLQFAINIFTSLFNLFASIPRYLTFVTASLNTLPAIILPFALASISIYVIYLVLGRN